MDKLVGKWLSHYTYSSSSQGTELASKHTLLFTRQGSVLSGKSMENDEGSVLTMKLEYNKERKILTGRWDETTSQSGNYRGFHFYGAVQFILNSNLTHASGKWIGFNNRIDTIKSGKWELMKC